MNREDLRIITADWREEDGKLTYLHPVTDAELAELGYVKVDGIDASKLGEVIHDSLLRTTGRSTTMGSFHAAEDAIAYLAAIEEEEA